jgi:hypothetical protein
LAANLKIKEKLFTKELVITKDQGIKAHFTMKVLII